MVDKERKAIIKNSDMTENMQQTQLMLLQRQSTHIT